MDEQYYVLLYSKYSNSCKQFFNILSNLAFPINYLCVDNQDIRKRILSSKFIKVSTVPCILFVNHGNIDKYEGNDAFVWINDISNKLQPQQVPEQQQQLAPQPAPPSPSHPKQQLKRKSKVVAEPIHDVEPPAPSHLEFTSIDDINTDDENEEENLKNIIKSNPYESEEYLTKKKKDSKKDGLLSAAMEMAKNRDMEDKTLKLLKPII